MCVYVYIYIYYVYFYINYGFLVLILMIRYLAPGNAWVLEVEGPAPLM